MTDAFRPVDSVLDHRSDTLVSQLHAHGTALAPIGDALANSYDGVPDMLRTVITWSSITALDASAVMRQALSTTIKAHHCNFIRHIDMALANAKDPYAFLAPIVSDSDWASSAFSTIAAHHPNSLFAYFIHRQRRLTRHSISPDVFISPARLRQQLCTLLTSALSDPSFDLPSLRTLSDAVSVIATHTVETYILSLSFLCDLHHRAQHPRLRRIAQQLTHAVRTHAVADARHIQTRASRHFGSSKSPHRARQYAVYHSLLAECRALKTPPDSPILNALVALLLPEEPSQQEKPLSAVATAAAVAATTTAATRGPVASPVAIGAVSPAAKSPGSSATKGGASSAPTAPTRRRMDREYAVLLSTYSVLIGDLSLTCGSADGVAAATTNAPVGGAAYPHAKANGGAVDDPDDMDLDTHAHAHASNTNPHHSAARRARADHTASSTDDDGTVSASELDIPLRSKLVLIRALCYPEVFSDLISGLFGAAHRISFDAPAESRRRHCLALLLAYAGVTRRFDAPDLERRMASPVGKAALRRSIAQLYKTVAEVAKVIEHLRPGLPSRFRNSRKKLDFLKEAISNEIAARAVVAWAQDGLKGGVVDTASIPLVGKHLDFLKGVARLHDSLRDGIFTLLRDAFAQKRTRLDARQTDEMQTSLLKCFVDLMGVCDPSEVLTRFLGEWVEAKRVNLKHIQAFVIMMLRTVEPPFKRSFAETLKIFLKHRLVAQAVQKDMEASCAVVEFRKNVHNLKDDL